MQQKRYGYVMRTRERRFNNVQLAPVSRNHKAVLAHSSHSNFSPGTPMEYVVHEAGENVFFAREYTELSSMLHLLERRKTVEAGEVQLARITGVTHDRKPKAHSLSSGRKIVLNGSREGDYLPDDIVAYRKFNAGVGKDYPRVFRHATWPVPLVSSGQWFASRTEYPHIAYDLPDDPSRFAYYDPQDDRSRVLMISKGAIEPSADEYFMTEGHESMVVDLRRSRLDVFGARVDVNPGPVFEPSYTKDGTLILPIEGLFVDNAFGIEPSLDYLMLKHCLMQR